MCKEKESDLSIALEAGPVLGVISDQSAEDIGPVCHHWSSAPPGWQGRWAWYAHPECQGPASAEESEFITGTPDPGPGLARDYGRGRPSLASQCSFHFRMSQCEHGSRQTWSWMKSAADK